MADFNPEEYERFVEQRTQLQSRLYAYVWGLIRDDAAAQDILQETNIVLWRKAAEFREGSNFAAWAMKVAFLEILAYRKKCQRDRLVFDEQLMGELSTEMAEATDDISAQQAAVRFCMEKLPPRKRDLIERRYQPGATVEQIAQQLGRPTGSVSQSLYRIRLQLADCVDKTLAKGNIE